MLQKQRERENIIYYNNVCLSPYKLGVGPFKAFLLLRYHHNCLLLEPHLEAKLAFMVAELVEQWEVSCHVSGCNACRLKVIPASRMGRLILVLVPSLPSS